jgi:hypothetical protein
MDYSAYIDALLKKFERSFTISEGYEFQGYRYDFYAYFHEKRMRYFASKKMVLDEFNIYEHCFFQRVSFFGENELREIGKRGQRVLAELVKPSLENMSTTVTMVWVVDDPVSDDIKKKVKRYKLRRSYWLNIKGWSQMRLVLVALPRGEVVVSTDARKVEDVYLPSF